MVLGCLGEAVGTSSWAGTGGMVVDIHGRMGSSGRDTGAGVPT